MRIHLVANVHRPDALAAAESASKWIINRGIEFAVEPETARHVKLPVIASEHFAEADLVLAFGGDGTLIRAAHLCSERGTPILGVYYGRFGFVTQCTDENLEKCVVDVIEGRGHIESRLMLEASLLRAGHPVASLYALNEVVLQRSISTRMLTFRVTVDGYPLTSYPADGVLVSTPTGSTAYNLSVGGPIVDPTLEALVLSAIAPHTLSARSLILRTDSVIDLSLETSFGESILSADAQTRLHVLPGDEVKIRRSERVTNLVIVESEDFLVKLRQRLLWSKGMFGEE
ncbi:MAG TPA: NAD(+)/NADH kinase [Fimbriimonas sp.]|nr:NAD(+)/NADH kinase [Fimbriimonas sp.]